jgi:hypothetical protein
LPWVRFICTPLVLFSASSAWATGSIAPDKAPDGWAGLQPEPLSAAIAVTGGALVLHVGVGSTDLSCGVSGHGGLRLLEPAGSHFKGWVQPGHRAPAEAIDAARHGLTKAGGAGLSLTVAGRESQRRVLNGMATA